MAAQLTKVVKKQIPVVIPMNDKSQIQTKGERDVDLLVENCQPIAENSENLHQKSEKTQHQIPSSIVVLTNEEKILLNNALFEDALEGVGLK